jgi:hypothetical protein
MDESGKTFLDGPRLEGGNYLSFISIFSWLLILSFESILYPATKKIFKNSKLKSWGVAQWERACRAYARPRVWSQVPQNKTDKWNPLPKKTNRKSSKLNCYYFAKTSWCTKNKSLLFITTNPI